MDDGSRYALVVCRRPEFLPHVEARLEARGYRWIAAAPEEAEAHLARERPALVVLDVMLPYEEGFGLLRRLKAGPETAEIPVVLTCPEAEHAEVFRFWPDVLDWPWP